MVRRAAEEEMLTLDIREMRTELLVGRKLWKMSFIVSNIIIHFRTAFLAS